MQMPVTKPARVGEIKFKVESATAATIATASDYWAASPKKIRAWDITLNDIKLVSEPNPSVRPRAYENPARVLLNRTGFMGFKCYLAGLNQTATDSVAVTEDDLGTLLKTALGGQTLGTTTTVSASNTGAGASTPLLVTSAAGIVAGTAIYVASTNEARRVVSVSSNLLTLDQDLSTEPTSGLCIASATYNVDPDSLCNVNDSGHYTLAALFRGDATDDQYQLRGVWPEIELADIGAGKAPKLDCKFHLQDWEYVTGVAADTVATEAPPPPQIAGGLYLQQSGTTANRYIHCMNPTITLGLTPMALEGPSGLQGVWGHIFDGGSDTVLEFEVPYDDEWDDAFLAGTKYVGGYQIGRCTTTAGAVLISFPALYIDETPQRGGFQGATTVKVRMHADEGSVTTNDLTRSRVAIHRFPHT